MTGVDVEVQTGTNFRSWLSQEFSPAYLGCSGICYEHFILQVVILHHMLSKATVKARPTVLWCYKKELGFSRYICLIFPLTWQ